jgi:hypothetical protein
MNNFDRTDDHDLIVSFSQRVQPNFVTGKSVSEALIIESVNSQYDEIVH